MAEAETMLITSHTFIGWNTSEDGFGTRYNAGSTFDMPGKNLIIYAQWTTNQAYSITK